MADSQNPTDAAQQRLLARAAKRGNFVAVRPNFTSISDLLQEMGDEFPNVAELDAFKFSSSYVNQNSCDRLSKLYKLPSGFRFVIADPCDRACHWKPNRLCIFRDALLDGFRIPFHEFAVRLLAEVGINPCQLSPNSWRAIHCFIVLCLRKNFPLSVAVFRCIFQFKNSPSNILGWVYINHRQGVSPIFCNKSLPDTNPEWRSDFIYCEWEGGDWGTLFRTSFCKVKDGGSGMIQLSPEEKLIILELGRDKGQTHYRKLLEEHSLRAVGLSKCSHSGNYFSSFHPFTLVFLNPIFIFFFV